VLESLPEWFGIPESIEHYVETAAELPFFRADLYDKPVGFCTLKINYQINADLYVLGIFRELHRLGIGKKLISTIESYCRKNGIRYLTVKTLSEAHPDKFYRKTRQFYTACGFKPFEEFPDLWGKENPCLYLLKPIG
jgi:GNAT superfamily N-acetyltransferase